MVTQGQWGARIANHVKNTAPSEWEMSTWSAPKGLPAVLDDPAEFLPASLPPTDLLIVLTESTGLTDLSSDLASLSKAQAVIVTSDRRSCAPLGLLRQVKERLNAQGTEAATPVPFCGLIPTKNTHALIQEFAQLYGCPELTCTVDNGDIVALTIQRESPCGNTRYIAENLAGVPVEQAVESAGLLHHYFPCWASMENNLPLDDHTLLHISAEMSKKAVEKAIERAKGIG
jgi:hypothetical protein